MICLRALGPARRLSLLRNASTQAPQNTLSSCVDIVKANDYEHLLCALLLPSNARAGAIALRALNVELSRAAVGPGSNENQVRAGVCTLVGRPRSRGKVLVGLTAGLAPGDQPSCWLSG